MGYQIIVKEIPEMEVVSVRYKGKYQDIGKYFGQLFKVAKGRGSGIPFALYYDESYCDEADIEVCLPVKGKVETSAGVDCKILAGGKFLSTTHQGSYDTLHQGYEELAKYMEANGLKGHVPSREIYLKGPGMIFKGNPKGYITEIVIPVE